MKKVYSAPSVGIKNFSKEVLLDASMPTAMDKVKEEVSAERSVTINVESINFN